MRKKNKILIVDDVEINRSLLADILDDEYEIMEAADGVEAITILNRFGQEISLILLDIVMPKMDGFDVLSVMSRSGWSEHIPVIIISAETSSSYIDHAYDLGAVEYINRPFDEKTVKHRVKNTIMLYSKQKLLENMVTEQILEKEKNTLILVEVLSHIVEFRNGESGQHVLHIRVMTNMLLKHLAKMTDNYNLTPSLITMIATASALHDIGKITIPEEILNKPGKLTPEEYNIMKTHSAAGAEMLEKVPQYQDEELIRIARDICRWHHERYDGGGYPDGLKGEEIPICAQIVALADVYDALTNERIYKSAYSHEKAVKMIVNGECGEFNPLLIQCLLEMAPVLEDELRIRSLGGDSRNELQDITRNILNSGKVSNRTLTLLEQERTKYQFFASMSKEIQFEYSKATNLLTISDWGADQLGLSPIINDPFNDPSLLSVFSREDYLDLREHLRRADIEDPIVRRTYSLNMAGEKRWFKAVARPLWVGDETPDINGVIGKFTDVHEEQVELNKLKQMAHHDFLTGLYNREYAANLIKNSLHDKRNSDKTFALIIVDLDFFKNANDFYGHIFGDNVLRVVANTLKESTRETDVVARIGGDEFLLFLEYAKGLDSLIERIFQSLKGEYNGFAINASMGIALFPENGEDYTSLFHCADQALYAAKRDGRHRYCYYNETMSDLLSVLSPTEDENR